MGFSEQRGDTLNVVNAAFNEETRTVEEVPAWKEPANVALVKDLFKYLLIAGVLFFLVFGVIRPALKDLAKSAQMRAQMAPPAPRETVTFTGARGGNELEARIQAVKDIAKQDPRVVASVVQDWINKE
jgi:flagellar M-ring protein FliF